MNIITGTYDKTKYPIGNGWDRRPNGAYPKSIIVHTTNGHKGSSFESEANYLKTSSAVGAHYLIGKDGRVAEILHPSLRAWHAGKVNDQRYGNSWSIGIECHYTPGEGNWTSAMKNALTELCTMLIKQYSISDPSLLETHRQIAAPKGRKKDPSGFSDTEFYQWRIRQFLQISNVPDVTTYMVMFDKSNIRQGPALLYNIAGQLNKGDVFNSVIFKEDETKMSINGLTTWAHVTKGTVNGSPIDHLGFIHTSLLKVIA